MSGDAPEAGSHERHIVRSTLVQQIAQGYGVLAMLVVITLLGRTLPLSEFGVYGLLVSLSMYLLLLQTSVEGATVRAIAGTLDAVRREQIFSTAVVAYVGAGLLAGLLIALGGVLVVGVIGIPQALRPDARIAVVALGVATAIGWPAKAFQDSLRGRQRFGEAALAEIVAYTLFLAGMVALIELDAPLWAVVALGGGVPILIGISAGIVLRVRGGRLRFRRSSVTRASLRELLSVSRYLAITGLADVVIYTLDRLVLAAFRTTATVGLYEGAARPHALVRQLHGTLAITVMPVASGYLAAGDDERLHDLLLRGTRYVMAIVVPVAVLLMTLSDRILSVWLGPKFTAAAPAMAIMLSYWILSSAVGVAGGMLLAAGRLSELTRYAWAVAVMNLGLSLALTPLLGLEGVVLGTAIPYAVTVPYLVWLTRRTFAVPVRRLAREAWIPAWTTGALVAAVLGALRGLFALNGLAGVVLAAAAALAIGWSAYAALWMSPHERRLVRAVLRRRVAAA